MILIRLHFFLIKGIYLRLGISKILSLSFCDGSGVICFTVTGHGGSDGLHGYVPSLDHVVADTVCIFLLSLVKNHILV